MLACGHEQQKAALHTCDCYKHGWQAPLSHSSNIPSGAVWAARCVNQLLYELVTLEAASGTVSDSHNIYQMSLESMLIEQLPILQTMLTDAADVPWTP